MGKRKEYTKDELKGFLTILKDITGIKYDTRNISSKDGCMIAMADILDEFTYQKFMSAYGVIAAENRFLKTKIEELKKKKANKKWWQFWK